jgi:hypothetical protein
MLRLIYNFQKWDKIPSLSMLTLNLIILTLNTTLYKANVNAIKMNFQLPSVLTLEQKISLPKYHIHLFKI